MNTGFSRTRHSLSEHRYVTSRYIPQLSFSFYRHQSIRADFSGGQITSDADLLPLRAFDQRHGLTRDLSSGFVTFAKRSVFVILYCRCFASASTRSSLATRMPTTRIAYVTIQRFRFLPINHWLRLSDHNQLLEPLGELVASRSLPSAGCSARLVCEDLWKTSPQTRRDPARCRFHRRSNLRATAAQLL